MKYIGSLALDSEINTNLLNLELFVVKLSPGLQPLGVPTCLQEQKKILLLLGVFTNCSK